MPEQNIKPVTAVVVSKSGSKSIKVAIDYKVKHPKYGKYIRRRTTLAVHDEHNKSAVGDIVEIVESRPYSKTKRWRLVEVLKHIVQE
jgi:small subunit ribosomal protein S17